MLDILSPNGKKKTPKSLCFFKAFGLKSIFTTALPKATPLSALESRSLSLLQKGRGLTGLKAALHALGRLPLCLLSLLQACFRVLLAH